MSSLVEEFESENLSIEYVALLDYLTEPIGLGDTLYDELENMEDNTLKNLFGEKVANRIICDDPDIAAYLKEDVGGVFIVASVRLPHERSVKFDENNNPTEWYLAPWRKAVYAIAPGVNSAIESLILQARKLKKEIFDKARGLQIETEKKANDGE